MKAFHRIIRSTTTARRFTLGVSTATLMLTAAGPALAAAPPPPAAVPLPSSALMGAILLGGLAAFARFPTGKRHHRRHRART